MKTLLYIILLLSFSCSKDESTSQEEVCDITDIELSLDSSLESYATDTDFTFFVEREDGYSYSYSKGSSSIDTTYESASTSEWISAAIILWLVDKNDNLDLSDSPSEHYSWSMPSSDPLYSTTLSQLLSFTSGLNEEAACIRLGTPIKSFDECINDTTGSIVSVNKDLGSVPNMVFHYGSSHLQLAGAMAMGAGSYSDWQSLFTAFKQDTGLLESSSFSLPSSSNPRLAGGMSWTVRDYTSFLRKIYHNEIFSNSLRLLMFTDHVEDREISYSPAYEGLQEQWHYGYGLWLECESSSFNCSSVDYYSSPGAYGAYPFISLNKKFFGMVGRQGSIGTYTNGINLYRSIRNNVEKWASCNSLK